MKAPLSPTQRADAAKARATRDSTRVKAKRLIDRDHDERPVNSAGQYLTEYGRLHDPRRVDLSGAPELREAFLRWLNGEVSQQSVMKASLGRLHREHPKLYRVVNAIISPVEQGMDKPTERVLAVQLTMSKTSVHRSIVALRAWLTGEGFGNGT